MPVTSVTTDADALTLTLVADFPAGVDRLWDAVTDARKLERFWGPPGYPATFAEFDLRPGGHAHYWMTSPEGERFHGRWDVTVVDAPRSYSVIDAFADADGIASDDLPAGTMTITVEATASGSRVTAFSTFASAESLRQQLEMGMVEGLTQGFGQLDVVLADLRETALGVGTRTELVDDTHVRITRAFAAPRHLLWRAHTDPELVRRWLLGPDGWEMTVCENDLRVGGSYRNAWAPVGGTPGEPFGFDGENLVIEPERRIVTAERMTGSPFPANINDLAFDEEDGVTLMTLLITYPDIAQRDAVLGTGMTDGMEASYARMERELLSPATTA